MLLRALVEQVARVRATPKKTEKTALIAELLRQAMDLDAELVALYLTGALRQGRIGVGWAGIRDACNTTPAESSPLTLAELDEAFDAIALTSGAGSAERRRTLVTGLFSRASDTERQFLAELLMGEVRQGALDGLVVEAIAQAAGLPAQRVRNASMFAESIGVLARTALAEGEAGLGRFAMQLLKPVAPMLANPAADVKEALERLGEAAFEWKIDGARVQIHKGGDEVRVFTRQLQDVTDRVPEILELARSLAPREILLEGEVLALRKDGRPFPFQTSMRRFGRSKGVEEARRELPLSPFFFDCLYLDGEGALLDLPYRERYERLQRSVPASALLPRLVTVSAEEAEAFLKRSLDAGHEGLMAKSLDAPYTAGQRGFHWLKLKSAHTLDLVVLAVEWGSGRRKGWLSNLHLGARDADSGGFIMLGKTFKGLTDTTLRWQTEKLLALEDHREGHVVYVRPELVVEIAFNEVQESPHYPGGMALRFARVKRYREDKTAAEADTIETVRQIFEQQRA